jgi:hypothetical protein
VLPVLVRTGAGVRGKFGVLVGPVKFLTAAQSPGPKGQEKLWQIPPVSDPAASCVDARCCTTRRHDTHSMDSRELRYPWHPWHGQPVWIRRTSARGGVPVFQCSLDPSSGKRLLEIPQWMFDASVVCLVRLSPSPLACSEALQALKELIGPRRATANPEVVQGRHPSLSHAGGSDAKPSEVASRKPTDAVSAASHNASLGELTSGGPAPDPGAARTAAARPRAKRRTGRSGGAR